MARAASAESGEREPAPAGLLGPVGHGVGQGGGEPELGTEGGADGDAPGLKEAEQGHEQHEHRQEEQERAEGHVPGQHGGVLASVALVELAPEREVGDAPLELLGLRHRLFSASVARAVTRWIRPG